MEVRTRASVGRRLLGVVVFVGALVIWEIWARAENSFYVPPLTEVLDRAWHVWPTNDFLTEASASVKRLAAGFVIGAGLGIAIGLLMGASRTTRSAPVPNSPSHPCRSSAPASP